MVGESRVLEDDTVVVFEHSLRFAVHESYARLVLQRQKVYGDTSVSFFVVRSGGDQ
jgi:16S rRNA G966 N2-methylase RsmD